MDLFEAISTRRSIRRYQTIPVPGDLLDRIMAAGTCAPYGRNQVWRFATVSEPALKNALAGLTRYRRIIESAPSVIAVFQDKSKSYHEIKDAQTMGACIQNMLLASHGLGLSSVWIGEILARKDEVRDLLGAPEHFELMAVITVGYPGEDGGDSSRLGLDDVVFLRK